MRACRCGSIPSPGVLLVGASMMARFEESGFEPIVLDGQLVHPMLRLQVAEGDIVLIEWEASGSRRTQGLGLRLRHPNVTGPQGYAGRLEVAGATAPAIMLWEDSSPPSVEVRVASVQPGGELRVSNRWRHEDGREDEWLNNYGMLIAEEDDGSLVLTCSDGVGLSPTFGDLVVRLRISAAAGRTRWK